MRGSMATVNIMAAEVPASELELEEDDEELLIEALRRHLTYVEVSIAGAEHSLLTIRSIGPTDESPVLHAAAISALFCSDQPSCMNVILRSLLLCTVKAS